MRFSGGLLAAALLSIGIWASPGAATEARTWYVYCEGEGADGHWAVFSKNFWPHAGGRDYGRRVGDAAKAFFEARHDLSLEGCAGVNFRSDSLAEHSRTMTVQLHRRMGDRVYFFALPQDVLPSNAPPIVSVSAESAPSPAEPEPAGATRALPRANGGWGPIGERR